VNEQPVHVVRLQFAQARFKRVGNRALAGWSPTTETLLGDDVGSVAHSQKPSSDDLFTDTGAIGRRRVEHVDPPVERVADHPRLVEGTSTEDDVGDGNACLPQTVMVPDGRIGRLLLL